MNSGWGLGTKPHPHSQSSTTLFTACIRKFTVNDEKWVGPGNEATPPPILTLVAQCEVTKNTYSMADKSALAFEQVVRVHG